MGKLIPFQRQRKFPAGWQRNRRGTARHTFIRQFKNYIGFVAVLVVAVLWTLYGQPRFEGEQAGREAKGGTRAGTDYHAVDGDSLRSSGQDIRLHGIDAPELHQTCLNNIRKDYPCGQEAKRVLAGLIAGKSIACAARDTDRYGRIVAVCRVDSLEINAEMVRLGWAIAYKKHRGNYVREEAEARAARRGLWQGDFEAPDSWRSSNRSGIKQGALGGEAAWDED